MKSIYIDKFSSYFKKSDSLKYLFFFILNILYSIIILFFSDFQWPYSPDSYNYAAMARGEPVEVPFKYRIIIPLLVGLFPVFIHKFVFLSITIICLSLCSIYILKYLQTYNILNEIVYFGFLFFMISRFYLYHLLNFGLIDPAFFLIFIMILYHSRKNNTTISLFLLIIGFFIKETIIFVIPIIMLELYFKGNKKHILVFVITIMIFGIILYLRESSYSNLTTIDGLINQLQNQLDYHGLKSEYGIIFNFMKFCYIYFINYFFNSYGLISFFILLGFFKIRHKNQIWFAIIFILEIIIASFLAVDWFRMMWLPIAFFIYLGLIPLDEILKVKDCKSANPYNKYPIYFLLTLFLNLVNNIVLVVIRNNDYGYRHAPIFHPSQLLYHFSFIMSLLITLFYIYLIKRATELTYFKIIFNDLRD